MTPAPSALTIRSATASDHDAVLRMVREEPGLPQWTQADLPVGETLGGALQRELLVAEIAGAVVGFAQVSAVAGEAEVEGMAVDALWRRHGAGRALLERGLAWAAEQAAQVVRLEVRASNAAGLALYRSAGFVEVGTRRAYYTRPVEDAVLMLRKPAP